MPKLKEPVRTGDRWTSHYRTNHRVLAACELCGGLGASLVVDHCHFHNIVRGTLCNLCNNAEGVPDWIDNSDDEIAQWRRRCHECVEIEPLVNEWLLNRSGAISAVRARAEGYSQTFDPLPEDVSDSKSAWIAELERRHRLCREWWEFREDAKTDRAALTASKLLALPLDNCERCGSDVYPLLDYCRFHRLRRGTLCAKCNADECTNLVRLETADHWDVWRKKCSLCADTEYLYEWEADRYRPILELLAAEIDRLGHNRDNSVETRERIVALHHSRGLMEWHVEEAMIKSHASHARWKENVDADAMNAI